MPNPIAYRSAPTAAFRPLQADTAALSRPLLSPAEWQALLHGLDQQTPVTLPAQMPGARHADLLGEPT